MNMPLVLLNRRRRGGSFSPYSLFSTTAIGIWLDPSDLTTMFSDRAGTTPVTTPGTVVGLRLDKSKGLVLGAELVTNAADRNFSSDTGFWTKEANVTISGGSANWNSATVDFGLVRDGLVSNGKVYEVTFTVSSISSGGIRVWAGAFAPLTATTTGTFTTRIACTANALGRFFFSASATGTTASIDNISVRELAGNHAVAPTDAARPIYGVEPKGGRRNLLTYSEQMDTASWLKFQSAVTANAVSAPDGTTTADTFVEGATNSEHYIYQSLGKAASPVTYTQSCYFKAGVGSRNFGLGLTDGTSGGYAAIFNTSGGVVASSQAIGSVAAWTFIASGVSSVGNGWMRAYLTVTTNSATRVDGVLYLVNGVSTGYAGDGVSGIYIWGAQLELGSTATNYQRVTTAYDITESGVATCHYVQYDGSDDSMSTSAIDFTGTDKMSVFAGVRKLSDAATAMIVESSADAGSNNGAFRFLVPGVAGYEYRQRGTLNAAGAAVSSGYASPISNVLTGLGDIGGDTATLRINGTQVAQSTADQGTGNFGNYPLFFGRRNNATLPFNGKDYGILVVGKAVTPTEITDTETWLAAKTSEVTL